MSNKTPLSKMMIQLYGKEKAQQVYDRCESLDPVFNQYVQMYIYDHVWADDSLSMREKSLATLVTLLVLAKEEQLQIHLIGFYYLGGTAMEIAQLLQFLQQHGYLSDIDTEQAMIAKVEGGAGEGQLSEQELSFIQLAACIAKGDNAATQQALQQVQQQKRYSEEQIRTLFRHQMIYCGCPCAMNGFAVLQGG